MGGGVTRPHPNTQRTEMRDRYRVCSDARCHATVLAGADVDRPGLVDVLEEGEAGVGEVVDVEEFGAWGAGAPDGEAVGAGVLGFDRLADERGQDVAGLQVGVVAGAVVGPVRRGSSRRGWGACLG